MMDKKIEALAGYASYLRDAIADGNVDPTPLRKWVSQMYNCEWRELGTP